MKRRQNGIILIRSRHRCHHSIGCDAMATNDLLYDSQVKSLVTICWKRNVAGSISNRDRWYNRWMLLQTCSLTWLDFIPNLSFRNVEFNSQYHRSALLKEVMLFRSKNVSNIFKKILLLWTENYNLEPFYSLSSFDARRILTSSKMNSFGIMKTHALYLFCSFLFCLFPFHSI